MGRNRTQSETHRGFLNRGNSFDLVKIFRIQLFTLPISADMLPSRPLLTVIWIDWYAYHIARFRALSEHPDLAGKVAGIELVGGAGVHKGMAFRDDRRGSLPVATLEPALSWGQAGQLRLGRALWKRLNQLNPAVLLIPGYYTAPGLAAALWGRMHGKRTVLMTESTERDHLRSPWKERFKSLLLRSCFDWAIAGGKPHARYLRALGFPIERTARFYNVVDNEFFRLEADRIRHSSTPAGFGLPERYFLYVGRLAPEKNVDGLIRAFAKYRHGGGNWSLVIVGDGPLAVALAKEALDCDVSSSVYFRGMQAACDLPPYYAFAGCFVLPSTREPWGLVVNEAMASGAPVIVSDRCGCAEDLVGRENGLVFDPDSSGALTACLEQIGMLPEEKRLALGAGSRALIERYSPTAWASEVARICEPAGSAV